MSDEDTQASEVDAEIIIEIPSSPEEFDALMHKIGEFRHAIEALELARNNVVATIDAPYAKARNPLVSKHDYMFDVALQYASDPANKARMTTSKSPQTADLTHSKVKYTDDHSGTIDLADDVTEDEAIRALRHRKGGGKFYKTTRTLIWGVIRAAPNEEMVLAMRHFVRNYKPTKVTLYVKPAVTPKPDGQAAEVQVKRYN